MHKEWCGKSCSECEHPCKLDEEIPCSPDCNCLGENGEHNADECAFCDSNGESFPVRITFDGVVYLCADSADEALELARNVDPEILVRHAGGTWEVEQN